MSKGIKKISYLTCLHNSNPRKNHNKLQILNNINYNLKNNYCIYRVWKNKQILKTITTGNNSIEFFLKEKTELKIEMKFFPLFGTLSLFLFAFLQIIFSKK